MAHHDAIFSNVAAEFLNYTDPRLAFDIVEKKDHSATEFVQNGQLVAVVYNRECLVPLAKTDLNKSAIQERHCPTAPR
jgi:hypothetical protein